MKNATFVTAVLLVIAALAGPSRAAAQSNPYPTGGGNASPFQPGAENTAAPAPSPLRALVSALAGYPSFAAVAIAWIPGTQVPGDSRSWVPAYPARRAAARREALARSAR